MTTPKLYRKRPVTIEAMELTRDNIDAVAAWCGGAVFNIVRLTKKRHGREIAQVVEIETLEGTMAAEIGDMVIRGVAGEFYPCKPGIFAESYEEPAELTYIDTGQETETSDTVPENTLAEGSVWDDSDELTLACRESGRDQITAIDCDGDVHVWGADAGWWETGLPDYGFEPYTILHIGKPVAP